MVEGTKEWEEDQKNYLEWIEQELTEIHQDWVKREITRIQEIKKKFAD
jgi:hypothetical protein